MITENAGGADASLDDDALYEQLTNPSADEGHQQEETPVVQPEAAQAEAAPEAQAEAPAEPAPVKEQPQEAHRVPLRELLDERDKRQALERQMEEMRRHIEAQKPKVQAPEFWEQPENSIDYRVQQAIQPLQQQLQAQREIFARSLAETQHGAQTVNEAFEEIRSRINSGDPSAQFDYQRVMAQPNPYSALVELHKQRQALAEIGTDPGAYRAKLQDQLLSDPAFLAKALEKAQQAAKSSPSVVTYQAAPRAGIPSINRIGAAASGGASGEDISDDDLYDRLTSPRR